MAETKTNQDEIRAQMMLPGLVGADVGAGSAGASGGIHAAEPGAGSKPAPTGGRGFRILAITAGNGNGWEFTEEVLKESLPLWDKVRTFIDHSIKNHSVRDLAGICTEPVWNEGMKGIQLTLTPAGPSAQLLMDVSAACMPVATMPAEFGKKSIDGIGFSADLSFTAKGKKVEKILKIHSLDLVIDPARGGVFLDKLSQIERTNQMGEAENKTFQVENKIFQAEKATQLEQGPKAIEKTMEADAAHEIRVRMCGYLLDSALTAAKLPEAASRRLRAQFSGKVFEPAELQTAIDEARALISELTGALVVQGPGRIHGMFNTEDKLQAATDDLLGAPREKALEGLKVERLSGIRELYLMLTGDREMHGGYYVDRIQLATSADFTGLVKNALNKIVVNTWEQLGRAGYDWWTKISVVEHFNSLQSITGTLVGTVGLLPAVAEGAEYTELAVGDSPETATFTKYGGYIPLTLELIDRDQVRKLAAYPRELASAGLRRISNLVAAIFAANSGIGPTMADGGALFNATAVTTSGGHANLLTTALAGPQWDVVGQAVYNQPMLIKNASGTYGTGPRMAISPRYLVVPRQLQLTAMQIVYPSLERTANIYTQNQQRGQPGDVVTVPEWTDATDWAAVCDPAVAPAIYVGERFGIMPEIFIQNQDLGGAVFTNDESRLKVRHFLAVWVNDFRPLHKENVAG